MTNFIPTANAGMLIRKPVAEVFEAITNPEITTRFWFTKSSGKLEAGKQVKWEWEMYGVASQVDVKILEENKRILMDWSTFGSDETPSQVDWVFTAHGDDTTFLDVTNSGFSGTDEQIVQEALGSTGGFTWVLAGLKALLEHDIELNLVRDRFPSGKPGQ